MTIKIENVELEILNESKGLRVKTDTENLLLINQTFEEISETVLKNYQIVKKHFESRVLGKINLIDLEKVCLKIVLYYLYMYNLWRTMYKKERNRDLTFLQKDFDHPYTSYQIIDYFISTYPDNYSNYCETMLDMTHDEFQDYLEKKKQFDNR